MYRGFVIKKSIIDNLPIIYTRCVNHEDFKATSASLKRDQQKQRDSIKLEILGNNGIIDADNLMSACMPQKHDYDIFISHSHKDIEYAQKLADYILKKFGLTCFIDSNIWLNSETDIQRPYDEMYKMGELYDYNDILKSSAHVHAMLSMSLLKMMDSCECCIFIDPEEEYAPMDSVLSPWIYEEVTMFNYIDKHLDRVTRVTESFSARPRIIYRCDFSNMDRLWLKDLKSSLVGYNWLDALYS